MYQKWGWPSLESLKRGEDRAMVNNRGLVSFCRDILWIKIGQLTKRDKHLQLKV